MEKKFDWQPWKASLFNNSDDDEDDSDDDEFDSLSYEKKIAKKNNRKNHRHGEVIFTPVGFIPVNDMILAESNVDFWSLRTNFNITEPMVKYVEKTNGVEMVIPVSRYQLKLGFNKNRDMFDVTEVKQNIERRMDDCDKYNNITFMAAESWGCNMKEVHKIDNMLSDLRNNQSVWLAYVLPNGRSVVAIHTECDDAFDEKVEFVSLLKQLVGGKSFSFSDDKKF